MSVSAVSLRRQAAATTLDRNSLVDQVENFLFKQLVAGRLQQGEKSPGGEPGALHGQQAEREEQQPAATVQAEGRQRSAQASASPPPGTTPMKTRMGYSPSAIMKGS